MPEISTTLADDAASSAVDDPTPKTVDRIVALCDWLVDDAGSPDTEFLGDLYQHHCEAARKGRALVQTPDFVREFILDHTLTPAIATFGVGMARTIDPSCGCGHFLVDAFRRLFAAWMEMPWEEVGPRLRLQLGFDPGMPREVALAQVALDQVVGVDLDPVCVRISRARLLLEAWAASGARCMFRTQVFEGDTLLHHRPLPTDDAEFGPWPYDVDAVRAALRPNQYACVVANPPYIDCPDKRLKDAYRRRYPTIHRRSPLYVPFMEVIFGLTIRGDDSAPARPPREHQGVLFSGICDAGVADA